MKDLSGLGGALRSAALLVVLTLVVCKVEFGQAKDDVSHLTRVTTAAIERSRQYPTEMSAPERELEQAYALRRKLTQQGLQKSIRLFLLSARQFSSSGRDQEAAVADLEAGDTYQMMSAYQQAIAAYRRSFALSAHLPEPRCAALADLARTYANVGRNYEAERYSHEAAASCGNVSDKVMANVLEAQGEVAFWSGKSEDAIAAFRLAIERASAASDRDGEALSMMMLAQSIRASDRDQGNRLAQTALGLWMEIGNEYGAARAHRVMGFFAADEGNFGRAYCHCERALSVFQRIADTDNAAIALNTLGLVARMSGDVETALEDYRQARRDFIAAQDDLGEADSIDNITSLLVSQDEYGNLLPLYAREIRLATTTNNRSLEANARMGIADVYFHNHRYKQAEANYERSATEYHAGGNSYLEGVADMRLASLRADQGKFGDALKLLDQAQTLKGQAGEQEDLARIGYLRARIYLKTNQLEEARAQIEKTIAVIESQRLRIVHFYTRAQYFASVHEYYSLYIQVLMALRTAYPDQGYERLAFEAAERSKVRALLDMLESAQPGTSCERMLETDLSSDSAQLSEQTPGASDVTTTQALSLPEIRTEISDGNTVLLEYELGKDRSFAWLVDREGILAFDLGPTSEIRASARAFRAALVPLQAREDEPPVEYLQRRRAAENAALLQSKRLAGLLLAPLHLRSQNRVLIVPDGPLQYIPFSALSVSDGRGITQPFVALNELTVLPSASVLSVLRRVAAKRPPPSDEITVFADPIFERSTSPASSETATELPSKRSRDLQRALKHSGDSQHIPSLPGSRIEALTIQQIVGPTHTRLALGFDANRDAVIDGSLARQRVIHFATHGIVDARDPEMSGLILSLLDKRGEYRDGYLRLSDIYSLKLSADLVVLSSCESALGKDLGSEGVIGLPRGFLYAGSRSVIASLWKVDDDATATLMGSLYSRMQRGEHPSAALRGAQLDMLKSKRFSQPYYWAAFVLEGDYK